MIRVEGLGHSQDPIVNKARRLREAALAKQGRTPATPNTGEAATSSSHPPHGEPQTAAAATSAQQAEVEGSPTADPASTGESEETWHVVDPAPEDADNCEMEGRPQAEPRGPTPSILETAHSTPTQPAASTATTAAEPANSSSRGTERLRSWQHVEQSLVEICSIARPGSREIQAQAEHALLNLLVDTQTAEELSADSPDLGGQPPQQGMAVTAAAAVQGLRSLRSLATTSSANPNVALSYAHVAPHVAVIVTWLNTMASGDVRIHAQLPPLLTPLREILNMILEGTMCAVDMDGGQAQMSQRGAPSSAEQIDCYQVDSWPPETLQPFQDLAMQLGTQCETTEVQFFQKVPGREPPTQTDAGGAYGGLSLTSANF
ncbi:unnamed protein product [Symbiodinium microadriaticum]|nr:unnamed protein product [Symbiodinium microadriaticum]